MKKILISITFFALTIQLYGQQSKGYQIRPPHVSPGNVYKSTVNVISNVPSYIWHRGCGPTALGMIIGYYDLNGFDDLFNGPSDFQTNIINMEIASQNHYSNYSIPLDYYPNLLQDASENGNPHINNSIADFMETSKSSGGNYWGWSWSSDIGNAFEEFISFKNSSYITETDYEFFTAGSWNEYKTEINNNRPVIILVDTDGDNSTDHFVVGIGYDDISLEFACFDTWDSDIHWYPWQQMDNAVNWGVFGFNKFRIINPVSSINNIEEQKNIINVSDILGRETRVVKNIPLLFHYSDGSINKKIIVE